METVEDTIPPTEPMAKPAAKSPKSPKSTKVPAEWKPKGSALVPDLEKNRAVIRHTQWYWIGALPGSPVEAVAIAGQCFPKIEEHIIKAKAAAEQVRYPVIGALVPLTKLDIDRMREALPRTIMRFTSKESAASGTGNTVEHAIGQNRKGFLVTIPKESDAKEMLKQGRAPRTYEQRDGDEPPDACSRSSAPTSRTPPEDRSTRIAWSRPTSSGPSNRNHLSSHERNPQRSRDPGPVAQLCRAP